MLFSPLTISEGSRPRQFSSPFGARLHQNQKMSFAAETCLACLACQLWAQGGKEVSANGRQWGHRQVCPNNPTRSIIDPSHCAFPFTSRYQAPLRNTPIFVLPDASRSSMTGAWPACPKNPILSATARFYCALPFRSRNHVPLRKTPTFNRLANHDMQQLRTLLPSRLVFSRPAPLRPRRRHRHLPAAPLLALEHAGPSAAALLPPGCPGP